MRTLALFLLASPLPAADTIDRAKLNRIDGSVAASIKRGDCPGAVVLVVHNDEVFFRKAYGERSVHPEKLPMASSSRETSYPSPLAEKSAS